MGIIAGISLTLLGALAAPNRVLAGKPNATAALDKIRPYQGVFGTICALVGVWGVMNAVLHIGWLRSFPIWWITYFSASLLEVALGLLLGIGVLKRVFTPSQLQAGMDDVFAKLAPKQGTIGMIAIGVGVWCIVANFAFA